MISAAATSCTNTASQIDGQLAQLKSYVQGLQAQWHGVASDTFAAMMVDYDTYGRMLHDSLVDIGSGLQGNFVNYESTEDANIKSLVSVNGAIPGSPGAGYVPTMNLS
jgi:WXG100 family type VII secretion target